MGMKTIDRRIAKLERQRPPKPDPDMLTVDAVKAALTDNEIRWLCALMRHNPDLIDLTDDEKVEVNRLGRLLFPHKQP